MAEEIKEILKEYTEDIKRHIGILKEDFDGKVALIGEQYSSIQEKLKYHDRRFDDINRRFDDIIAKVSLNTELIKIIRADIELLKILFPRKLIL